jgi:RNA polymerase sigma factor
LEKSLERILVEIKEDGSKNQREKMIEEYIPFIIKTVSRFTGRYIQPEHSDEYAIALEAFNEAIDRYDQDKGKFISYASLVITSRLKDYVRSLKGKETVEIGEHEQLKDKSDFERGIILKSEIELLKSKLSRFGISFEKLEDSMPVHVATREKAIDVAHLVAENHEIYEQLNKTHRLPRKMIQNHLLVSDKQLKRSRIYIIAVAVVLSEDLDTIREIVQL